ncbi:copper resistance CopC family protein [Paractinoplanes atraurantiacus]|uniref:Copper-binding protein CopC (Methionine-rich) n=1 Tax=Paractinoplanes atraurantiacus TaxID=1036182 RepID=A0A285IHM4_9ACTN|nr:copper resistance protein CopC [Actinoplanes atraurantiacus]SNY47478.1 Copper-binding protein CopC (methionine-rich) [Actinoplanes atraurantiacus]
MKPLRRGLLALAAVAVVVFGLPPSPAAAHGTLGMSVPAQGATVSAPLGSVELFFTEKVPDNAYFAISAPGGGRVDNGWEHAAPRALDKPVTEYFMVDGKFEPRQYTTGYPARVRVAHLPATGEYRVDYQSKASDGDPVRGSVTFKYTGPATAAPVGWTPPTGQPDATLGLSGDQGEVPVSAPASAAAPIAAPPADERGNGLFIWLAAAVAVAAAAGFLLWRRVPALSRGRSASRNQPKGRAPARDWPKSRASGASRSKGATSARGRSKGAATGGGQSKVVSSGGQVKGGASSGGQVKGGASSGGQVKGGASEGSRPEGDASGRGRPDGRGPEGRADDGEREPGGGDGRRSIPVGPLAVGAVVVALIGGYALGRSTAVPEAPASPPAPAAAAAVATGHQHSGGAATLEASGTAISSGGYTLQPVHRSQAAKATTTYTFRILGADKKPATRYAVVHDKPLHLVVIGRDLANFQHLHPTMAPDGLWSVPLALAKPGAYRIFADFTVENPAGAKVPLVLGADHHVPGDGPQTDLPPAATTAQAGPFSVTMEGSPKPGATVPVLFRVTRGGAPVSLERYLGSYGHLVILREGDLGYVHVHPDADLADGAVKVAVSIPAAARYRAFLEFQVDGKIQRAEFTLDLD